MLEKDLVYYNLDQPKPTIIVKMVDTKLYLHSLTEFTN